MAALAVAGLGPGQADTLADTWYGVAQFVADVGTVGDHVDGPHGAAMTLISSRASRVLVGPPLCHNRR